MPYFLTTVPNWTVPYDMPSTALNSNMMNILGDSLKISIKAMGSTGIIILGVVFSVYLIASVFRSILGRRAKFENAVNKKVFERSVHEEDVNRNFDSIVENNLINNGIRRHVHNIDVERNFKSIVDSKVLDRKINRAVNSSDALQNRQAIIEDKILSREINAEANKEYKSRHHIAASNYYRRRVK